MSICIRLDVNWNSIGSQLAQYWMLIGIWLFVNRHSIGSQFAFHWLLIDIQLSLEHWIGTPMKLKCCQLPIVIGFVDSIFCQQRKSGWNRGFSLVESSECWLLIGREVPPKIFKGGTLMILGLCQLSFFEQNCYKIGSSEYGRFCGVNSMEAISQKKWLAVKWY